jgi:hypothetical protein
MLWAARSGSHLSFLSTVKVLPMFWRHVNGKWTVGGRTNTSGSPFSATSLPTACVKNQSQNSVQNSEGRERPRHLYCVCVTKLSVVRDQPSFRNVVLVFSSSHIDS